MINAALVNNIYKKAIFLKRYTPGDLISESKRSELTNELNVTFKLCCELLKDLRGDDIYQGDYINLLMTMLDSLFECVALLAVKGKSYRTKVWRRVHGLHNLPRAFLDDGNADKISVETAIEYYEQYLKSE